MKHFFYTLSFCASVLLFSQCTNTEIIKSDSKTDTTQVTTTPQLPYDTSYNRLSLLIAGMDSVVDYSQNNWNLDSIKIFARNSTAKMKLIEIERLTKLTQWNDSNLKRNNQDGSGFAFYPFSGGDFIHLAWLYPNASEYLMVAREDVGTIPNLFVKDAAFVNNYLSDIDTVLRDIYTRSYFITKNMVEDTKKNTLVNGMLPLILWGAAHTGHQIVSLNYFNVDTAGSLQFVDTAAAKKRPNGLEIMLRHIQSGKERKITYLSCDISDDGFAKAPRFSKFISSRVPQGCNSFVKSASYLMHYSSFSSIRNMVISKSNFFVQDDTGIPYKELNQNDFNVELFGVYEMPIKDFDETLFQPDLNAAYQDSTKFKGALNFSLGYHWGSKKQNQLVASRIVK